MPSEHSTLHQNRPPVPLHPYNHPEMHPSSRSLNSTSPAFVIPLELTPSAQSIIPQNRPPVPPHSCNQGHTTNPPSLSTAQSTFPPTHLPVPLRPNYHHQNNAPPSCPTSPSSKNVSPASSTPRFLSPSTTEAMRALCRSPQNPLVRRQRQRR